MYRPQGEPPAGKFDSVGYGGKETNRVIRLRATSTVRFSI